MQKVVVQGLGFVGLAMSIAIASAKDKEGKSLYKVIGLDLPNADGIRKVNLINEGKLPLESSDEFLKNEFHNCILNGNLHSSVDPEIIKEADFVIVDINFDVDLKNAGDNVDYTNFAKAIETIGTYISKDSLIIIETTVPPGTTENIAYPILQNKFQERKIDNSNILLAHSYERVMPGPDYLNSIKNFWRVYSGCNYDSKVKCKNFLNTIINVDEFDMTELDTPTASESAKVLENSYRAMNIAFIDEWSNFAEAIGINLFDVISAIKVRPTHKNIMEPGLGVGGYCLTKDPLMGIIASKKIFNKNIEFPLSKLSVQINQEMPKNTLNKILKKIKKYKNKSVLIMGISYRQDVGDLRYSASESLIDMLVKNNIIVDCHDPMVSYTNCKQAKFIDKLPEPHKYSIIVFAVKHSRFKNLNLIDWLNDYNGLIIDANHIFENNEIDKMKKIGLNISANGRGDL